MRIFLDTEALLHWPSGIGVYVRGLLDGFRALGDQAPEVVTGYATARSELRRELRGRLVDFGHQGEWHEWPMPGRLASRLGPLRRFACRPALAPVDLVHGTCFLIPQYAPGNPRIVTIHDLGFVRYPERRFGGDVGEQMTESVLAQIQSADRILAISEFTKTEICDLCGVPPEKVCVTYLATQWTDDVRRDDEQVARTLAKYGLERDSYLLSVGLISPRKNFTGLLDAFARFRQDRPEARLALVGRIGWDAEPVQERLDAMAPYARRLDVGDTAELADLYTGARGFFLPSWYEGFGIPVIEAMQCGCPVCGSTPGALAEVIGDAGLTVPPDDEAAIVDVMRRIWDDADLRASLRAAGLSRAREFTWTATARSTLAAYRSTLGDR